MKILQLEDHPFFANEVTEYLTELGHVVTFVESWDAAEDVMLSGAEFDACILDVVLKNGKTGLHFAKKWKDKIGRPLFITGCVDEITINAVNRYSAISKLTVIWKGLDEFIAGGSPKIL
jgi:DNA-binding response OmpR family regulator